MGQEQVGLNSRLRFTRFVVIDGVRHWDMSVDPEIPEQSDDLYIVVQLADRLDSLAFQFYGDENAQWVIAAANGMEIWPTKLIPGAEIRIPSPRWVRETLFAKAIR